MPMTRFDKAEYYKLVIVSYFVGYKVAYNRLKNSTGQIFANGYIYLLCGSSRDYTKHDIC